MSFKINPIVYFLSQTSVFVLFSNYKYTTNNKVLKCDVSRWHWVRSTTPSPITNPVFTLILDNLSKDILLIICFAFLYNF